MITDIPRYRSYEHVLGHAPVEECDHSGDEHNSCDVCCVHPDDGLVLVVDDPVPGWVLPVVAGLVVTVGWVVMVGIIELIVWATR